MNIRKKLIFFSVLIISAAVLPAAGTADARLPDPVDIPYEKFVLDNGLTLIVHEDHKAPIVAVNIWYHVGSKNEKLGKTGFAHLFEHLMFNGTENFNDEYFGPFEKVGATDMNGTTNRDRTNYFQNVPVNALDLALWMESDRMGHLLGVVTQEKLDEQRGVVQNEKRQGENQPYGLAFSLITENTYPKGHPYSWTTIGSMEDLDAASLEDVHEWFKTYYGAANAILAVAGDISTQEVKKKVEEFFGDIPAGPPISRQNVWVSKRTGSHRQILQDRVPQSRIYKVWNVPQMGSLEHDQIDVLASVLGSGKTSRLYKRLVYTDQSATDAQVFLYSGEIGSQVMVMATARPGQDLGTVERAIDEELQALLRDGPTETEVQVATTELMAGFIRGAERIGGFGGKSDILAMNEVYGGSPDFYKTTMKRFQEVTPAELQRAGRDWLSDGVYILEVHPFGEYTVGASSVDRSRLPDIGAPPEPDFPGFKRAELSNGLELILAERHAIPEVNFQLTVNAGYAADQMAHPGTASLTMATIDEGTATRNALQISEELALLGAELGSGSNLDASFVRLSALKANLDPSLEIFADVILNPAFPPEEFERQKQQQLARIQREKQTPTQMALRLLPRYLYGEGHPYGNPLTGSGTEDSLAQISRETLVQFQQTWFKPNNAQLIVVGDTTLEEIQPKLEALFKGWAKGEVPDKQIAGVESPAESAVYLMDRPGSIQTLILAGIVAPPTNNPDEIPIQAMNEILGGSFTSRLNMNLREEKHWSYGAGTFIQNARGQRPFIAYAPVQTDKTKESLVEVRNELQGIISGEPPTGEELDKVQKSLSLSLPGQWETSDAVLRSISEIVQYGLPDDYYDTYPDAIQALDLTVVAKAADQVVRPGQLVWLIVGDLSQIEDGVRELELGRLQKVDANGNPLP